MPFLKKIVACAALLACLAGTAAHADDLRLLRDEETEQALKTMSTPIFERAGLSPDAVKFIIVESHEMNAFVAGGQNIFLYTDLILKTDNPEEILGVIAHETGHIADGHLFRGRVAMSSLSMEALLANLLGIAVAVGGGGQAGGAISSASQSIITRKMLRHTRTQEGAADRAGVRYLTSSGLPLSGFLSFMKKLESQELIPESDQSQYVRTHPLTQDRVESLQHAVAENPAGVVPAAWIEMHSRYKAKLLGYIFPDRALLDKGTSVAAQYGHAVAWFRKHEAGKALAALAPLIAAEPGNPYFLELKAQILFDTGQVEESIPVYAQAVELAPFSGLIRIAYAQSLLEARTKEEERVQEAIRQLHAAMRKEKQSSGIHRMLAIAYGKQGQEGLSRLHLAEQALMQGRKDFAKREAGLARQKLKEGTPGWQRAQDILDLAFKDDKKGGADEDTEENEENKD